MYISEYSVDRRYGGPEEGGWWYDVYTFIRTVACALPMATALSQARALNREEKKQRAACGERDRYSMNGGPDTVYLAEPRPGGEDNHREARPYYE